MKKVMEVVGDWVGAGDPVALATVVDTKKSAPQPPGTKMAINEAGRMAGAVSGGGLERPPSMCTRAKRERLARGLNT